MPTAAFVSFRLGLDDGVSIVARTWRQAFEDLEWSTFTVAGEGPVDRIVPGLALGAPTPPDPTLVKQALSDADLVVVENLLSIPMNLPASRVVASELRGRPALLHHHDPPWQRERYEHITELPPVDPHWQHVTINSFTEAQFLERGIKATTIYNGFEMNISHGDRAAARAAVGIGEDELLFVHPVRAIERKNIPTAIEIAARCGATYWLTGRAEDGYGPVLNRLLAEAPCRVIHQPAASTAELYDASDLVLFPSTWEGFGNPPIEAAIYSKPVVVGDYPVASELRDLGFSWLWPELTTANIAAITDAARNPSADTLKLNRSIAEKHLSLSQMTLSVKSLLEKAGW